MSSQLKLVDITKKFEANTVNEKVALDHLNLTVEPGQFVTVLGSNGSGKSTMFNVILGSLFPDEGKVYLGDKDITKLKDYKRALNIGCLYQNPLRGTAPNLTIEENLALAYTRKASPSFFALNKKDSSYFREVLSTLGMGLEDRMKMKIDFFPEDSARQPLFLWQRLRSRNFYYLMNIPLRLTLVQPKKLWH